MNAKSHKTVVAVVVTALVALGSIFACQQENLWDLATLEESHGMFIAAGDNGVILSSSDGKNWTKSGFADPDNTYYSIATDKKGTWMIVGYNNTYGMGIIFSSTDSGKSWKNTTSTNTNGNVLRAISTNQSGAWVVASDSGYYAVSSNSGASWSDSSFSNSIYGIAHNSNRFVTVGSGFGSFHYSTDAGTSWQTAAATTPSFSYCAVTINNAFLSIGTDVWASNDGYTWDYVSSPFGFTREGAASNTDGRVIAVGETPEGSFYSDDSGVSWTLVDPSATSNLIGITFGKGIWVTVGADSTTMIDGVMHYSTDNGSSWSFNVAPASPVLRCVAYGYR
ncbi:MAG TPA: hypothetical protein PKJ16_17550 [Spirochaetota bacterium]|nr:hypothetical protein [Spirochaetota bacterium]HOS39230.1 hypothetical protein [Spirochaetota bacterium]HPU87534.1 hypothetical protein [Spirochaetota bacterium]